MTTDQNMPLSPEFHDRVCRYADGNAATEDVVSLEASLAADSAARRVFLEVMNLASAIEARAAELEGDLPRSTRPGSRRLPPAAAILLAVSVGGALAGLLMNRPGEPPSAATVVRNIGGGDTVPGGRVSPQRRCELAFGMLELVTVTGVRIVIEAPAVFEFDSPQRMRLHRGRIAADVPPAGKGFTVVTPSGQAVDLGTSFGVAVGDEGDAEVHVFKGEVIAEAEGNARSVRGHEAVSLGENTGREVRTAAFIRNEEMASLEAGFASGQMARASRALEGIRRDPAVIAVFDFDEPNLPTGKYGIVQGRWPGSKAADFAKQNDFMPVVIGDDQRWPQVTLAAWVRLDRIRNSIQSLYHTDRWLEGTGHIHWMVSNLRTIRMAIRGSVIAPSAPERSNAPDSSATVDDEVDRWTHLASVYDAERQAVRFFVNGRFDHETRLSVAPAAILGPGRLGNWIGQERHLSGRIDELIVLGRALSDEEIRDLHSAGTPY